MKKLKLVLLKLFIGYFINSVVVFAMVFLIHHRFNFDYYDAIFICGFAIIIFGFIIRRSYEHTLPPISIMGRINSGVGGRIAHTAMVNSVLKDYENNNLKKSQSSLNMGWYYFVFHRSRLEIITYGIILILIVVINYNLTN